MIRVGDKVRHWCRGYMGRPEDDWMMFGGGIGPMTVVRVIELDGEDWAPDKGSVRYFNIHCALPPPFQQEAHYHYFTLRETSRPWQMRSNGNALHVVSRAPTPAQADLFESLRKIS